MGGCWPLLSCFESLALLKDGDEVYGPSKRPCFLAMHRTLCHWTRETVFAWHMEPVEVHDCGQVDKHGIPFDLPCFIGQRAIKAMYDVEEQFYDRLARVCHGSVKGCVGWRKQGLDACVAR